MTLSPSLRRKLRRLSIGLVVLFVCIGLCGYALISRHVKAVSKVLYTDYAIDYMAIQKHLTGKWPTNLDGLPADVKAEKDQTQAYYTHERLDRILNFHKDFYQRMEIVSSSDKKCSYILHLSNENVKGEVDLKAMRMLPLPAKTHQKSGT